MNQIVVLQTWSYRFYENMFYGKMESRNEDIVFPARAGQQFTEAVALCSCLLNATVCFCRVEKYGIIFERAKWKPSEYYKLCGRRQAMRLSVSFFCRSPASGQADNGMVGIVGFPAAEGDGMA